jgi:hypothetical protein
MELVQQIPVAVAPFPEVKHVTVYIATEAVVVSMQTSQLVAPPKAP